MKSVFITSAIIMALLFFIVTGLFWNTALSAALCVFGWTPAAIAWGFALGSSGIRLNVQQSAPAPRKVEPPAPAPAVRQSRLS